MIPLVAKKKWHILWHIIESEMKQKAHFWKKYATLLKKKFGSPASNHGKRRIIEVIYEQKSNLFKNIKQIVKLWADSKKGQ